MKQLLALVIILMLGSSTYAQKTVALKEIEKHIGDSVVVEGPVMDTRYLENASNAPTFFNMGGKYPNHLLTVIIWGNDRKNFADAPETTYRSKYVRVKGKVEEYKGKPQIIVRNPDQIEIISDVATPPAIKE